MKDYAAAGIKNIAVAGHGGAGKTSLIEAMLYRAGQIDRLGSTAEGNTVSDYDPEEIRRTASLSLSVVPCLYGDQKINLLDAPGQFEFEAGLHEAIHAADSVMIVVSGKSGVTVGAKKAFSLAKASGRARLIFVNKLDRESADFYRVLADLKAAFGAEVCPLVVPYVEDHKVQCYINLIDLKAYSYDKKGNAVEVPMPDYEQRLEGLMEAISEAVAETDETLFEKFFSGEKFTHMEFITGLHAGIKNGTITPVFCGSALELAGINLLLGGVTEMLPSAAEMAGLTAEDPVGNAVSVACDEKTPTVAYVFKTVADPFVGKMSYIKVVSGALTPDQQVVNMTTGQTEQLGKLCFITGKKQEDAKKIPAGDIGVAAKLSAVTGDTLCAPDYRVKTPAVVYPVPCHTVAVAAKNKGDEGKISQGISRLLEEDPTLSFSVNSETHQQLLSGMGEQHLEVAAAKLKNKFGVEITLAPPIIPYRETIRKKVKVQGRHKKQTGGHGQFGDVWIEFEPCDSETLVFEEKVFGGSVPKGFFPAVEKGLQECMQHGVLAGYPTVGVKATLVDGSYHPVDSSEMAFKTAAGIAFRAGMEQADPMLLEPIMAVAVTAPDSATGDLMGEFNKRRGRVLGMNPASESGLTVIEAEAPQSELTDFVTVMRQITQGSGSFTLRFARYEPLPAHLAQAIIDAAK